MKTNILALAFAGALAVVPVAAHAADTTTTGYGSAVYDTKRNCPADATRVCDGRTTDQRVVQSSIVGGAGQAVTNSFTVTGTGAGSTATSDIKFGGLGLPVIKTSAKAAAGVRIGNNNYAYQSYSYGGTESFDLQINSLFHIDDSSTDGLDGTRAGGAIASAYFAIWKKADFLFYADPAWTEDYVGTDGGLANPQNLVFQAFLFGSYNCTDFANSPEFPRRALATGYGGGVLSGGETSIAIGQNTCGGGALTINPGDEFVIATYTQLVANRDGFIDATGTYTVSLDPAMGRQAIQAFSDGVTYDAPMSAAPEPASWAMMIGGFGIIGASLRRRRADVRLATI